MTVEQYCEELKQAIIADLNLEDISLEDITNDTLLFSPEGLGLDSLDAVELVVVVAKRFQVEITSPDEAIAAFQSVKTLAQYIMEHK